MAETIFTKIVRGEIPAEKVYEDEQFLAFLDINPVNKGHTLVITKEPYRDFLELPPELYEDYFRVIRKIAQSLLNELRCDGINLLFNTGSASGQEVFHIHAHIIPRYENDGFRHWKGTPYKGPEEMADIGAKIRAGL